MKRTICEEDISKYPSYRDMAANRNAKRNSLHFISVNYNVGSTTHDDISLAAVQKQSFGCPRLYAIILCYYMYMDYPFHAKLSYFMLYYPI